MQLLLLVLASFVAGSINSVAGGGTLLTFPSLLAVQVPSVVANATSTVALVPGSFSAFWGYRKSTRADWNDVFWFAVPSLVGGTIGALVLVRGGESFFNRLVPWLLFAAVGLFIAQEPMRRFTERFRRASGDDQRATFARRRVWAALLQLFIAVYGGFFGAGMGILMLATMGLMGLTDIHEMNRLKNISAVAINGVAGVTFALAGKVRWPFAAGMAVAAILGGYWGAGVAQRIGQLWVRRIVIVIGLVIGMYTLVRPL
jgi:uncharacterized membrane protein YfcA